MKEHPATSRYKHDSAAVESSGEGLGQTQYRLNEMAAVIMILHGFQPPRFIRSRIEERSDLSIFARARHAFRESDEALSRFLMRGE
jgi:hypothetical protein